MGGIAPCEFHRKSPSDLCPVAAFLSVHSHSYPLAQSVASVAQNAEFQKPALVPQRYPLASVFPRNTSLSRVGSPVQRVYASVSAISQASLCASVSRGTCYLF